MLIPTKNDLITPRDRKESGVKKHLFEESSQNEREGEIREDCVDEDEKESPLYQKYQEAVDYGLSSYQMWQKTKLEKEELESKFNNLNNENVRLDSLQKKLSASLVIYIYIYIYITAMNILLP